MTTTEFKSPGFKATIDRDLGFARVALHPMDRGQPGMYGKPKILTSGETQALIDMLQEVLEDARRRPLRVGDILRPGIDPEPGPGVVLESVDGGNAPGETWRGRAVVGRNEDGEWWFKEGFYARSWAEFQRHYQVIVPPTADREEQ